ncbi:MAG: threonine/serine exporter family protein [Clostridiales bacterium]|jgi:uncharacterized membrane protein YjjB (DUF3815 family)|nr:threonine/serine exporter family protein [Clostridiales bacterium]
MSVVIQFFMAFFGALGFSIVFNAPRGELLVCGLAGGAGWTLYILLVQVGVPSFFSAFIATAAVTLASRTLANLRRMPLTVFLVSGIIPFVPGAGIYYTMYYTITGDTAAASLKGIETFKMAGVIGVGIMLVLALPGEFFAWRK